MPDDAKNAATNVYPNPPPHESDSDPFFTVQEAAKLLQISDATVRQAILQGRLECVIRYNRKLIPRTAVDEYRIRRGKPDAGRPPRKTD